MEDLLPLVKLALRLSTDRYDTELYALMDAAKEDLRIAGVTVPETLHGNAVQAVLLYCKLHFGAPQEGEWDRLKRAYDEHKAQLSTASGYTDWEAGRGTS